MDSQTASVLTMNLGKLTPEEIKYLHDLKAQAIKGWAREMLIQLKQGEGK